MPISCLIVGGGLIGRSVAYYLSRFTSHILVIDEDPVEVLSPPTRASLGVLTRPTTSLDALSHFYRVSHALYQSLAAELVQETGIDVGWTACGGVEVAYDDQESTTLHDHVQRLQQRGAHCQWLTSEQVAAREPDLVSAPSSACLWPADHQVDPQRLSRALWSGAEQRGARYQTGCVRGFDMAGNPAALLTTGERLEADAIILCAGAHSHGLLADLGLPSSVVRAAPGQSLRLQTSATVSGIVHWAGYHMVPTPEGTIAVGATNEPVVGEGIPAATSEEARVQLMGVVERLLGAGGTVVAHEGGLRPKPRRGRPVIDRIADADIFLATGHYKNGVLMAPATGQALARWIVEGEPGIDLSPFRIRR